MKQLSLNIKNVDIPVIFENSKSLNVACLKLVFKASGSYNESIPGLAKLSSLMLNEGDSKLGSEKFALELEKRAICLDVNSGLESMSIEINCLKEHFDFSLSMLKSLLQNPNLTLQTLKKSLKMTLGEISSNENDNDYLAKCGLMEILYPDTNLSYPLIGTKDSLSKISLDDVKDFISSRLDLENLFLVFGGDVNTDDLKKLEDVLGVLNNAKQRELCYFQTNANSVSKEILKQTEQSYIYFGSPYDVKNDEKYKASVATFILGAGGFGSRIMEEIRVKRGLAYSAYARGVFNLSYKQMFGYMQTKNESQSEAIEVIKDEFLKFIKDGVKKKELDQAKKFLLGSLPLSVETLFKRLNIAQGEFYNGKKLGSFLDDLEKIQNLSLNELNDFIALHDEISRLSFCILKNED